MTKNVEVFELCFKARNRPGCFDLRGEPNNDPPTVNAEGDGSIVITNGEVCIEDRIIVTSIESIDASCNGTVDGGIRFTTAPREDDAEILIRTSDPVRIGRDGSVSGLPAGPVSYVIYVDGDPSVREEGTISVGIIPENAAVANAGEDKQISCEETPRVVVSGRNNLGKSYRFLLVDEDGAQNLVSSGEIAPNGAFAEIAEATGLYVLEVTSEKGCTRA